MYNTYIIIVKKVHTNYVRTIIDAKAHDIEVRKSLAKWFDTSILATMWNPNYEYLDP